jgi:hypothetical protein
LGALEHQQAHLAETVARHQGVLDAQDSALSQARQLVWDSLSDAEKDRRIKEACR